MRHEVEADDKKRKYNSMTAGAEVTPEEMEAYRMRKQNEFNDPMANFGVGEDELLEYNEEDDQRAKGSKKVSGWGSGGQSCAVRDRHRSLPNLVEKIQKVKWGGGKRKQETMRRRQAEGGEGGGMWRSRARTDRVVWMRTRACGVARVWGYSAPSSWSSSPRHGGYL